MMKKLLWILVSLVILFPGTGSLFAQTTYFTLVNLSPEESYQTVTGFGASLAFYEGWLTAHPKKAEIYDVIFKELSLDILRVRNAYGYDNTMIGRVKEFNQAAQKSLGRPIDILVSSWGPPAYLKSNNNKNNGGTIKYSVSSGKVNFQYAEFARWWNQSLDNYAANGIYPTYVSIQNEPDWKADYESCLLNPAETFTSTDTIAGYNKALEAVYDTIRKRSHIPRLLGPECVGIGYFGGSTNGAERYVNALDQSKLYGIAHHLYHGADEANPWSSADFEKMGKFRSQIPHFQTEYSRGEWFPLAGMIYKTFNDENAVAYLFWDLIWDNGGLVDLDFPWDVSQWTDRTKGYQRTKHFWVFKQFSAYIHPGWKRVKTGTPSIMVKTLAFLSADRDSATLVAINTSSTTTYGLKAAITGYAIDEAKIYRTSASEDGAFDPLPADSVVLKPKSITTVAMKISSVNTAAGIIAKQEENSCSMYPDPFRESATLRFTATEAGNYILTIYDLMGRTVGTEKPGFFAPGDHQYIFSKGNLRPGTYLYKLSTGGNETGRGRFSIAD